MLLKREIAQLSSYRGSLQTSHDASALKTVVWDTSGVFLSFQWHQKDFIKAGTVPVLGISPKKFTHTQKKSLAYEQNKVSAAKKLKTNFSTSTWLHENITIFILTHFILFWQKAAKIISLHPYWKWISRAKPIILGGVGVGGGAREKHAEGGNTSTATWYSGRPCIFILGKAFLS